MVHALEEIRRLLKPGGILVDIHPAPEGASIEVYQDGRLLFSERRRETCSEDEDVLHAEKALAQAVERELFVVEKRAEFDFLRYASSAGELSAHWEELWAYEEQPEVEDLTLLDENLYAQVEEILQASGAGAEIAVNERVRIARLRPMR